MNGLRLLNAPSDAEFLNALERWLSKKNRKLSITTETYPHCILYRVGTGSKEVSLRIALRMFLQRVKELPPPKWSDSPSESTEAPKK